MARRPRSSTAWHFVLSAARRDADARAVALAGSANWGYDSDGQVFWEEEVASLLE
ncbi:SPRY domain-containing SOCS box protein 3 isoform X1 [Prionailurus iriomotensis]